MGWIIPECFIRSSVKCSAKSCFPSNSSAVQSPLTLDCTRFGPIFWMLILGVIIWAVVTFVNNSRSRDRSDNLPQQESALDILKKRYAKGEITKEEFEQMKIDLQ